jgi:hypothetical protein
MDTPDLRPTSPPPRDTDHLEVTQDDVAACFRPWAAAEGTATHDQPSPAPEQPGASATSDMAGDEDPLDPVFTDDILHALIHALPSADTDTDQEKHRHKAAAIHLLRSLDAQQPIEAALATQAVLAHHAALAAFRRAAQPGQFSDITGRETGSAARMSTVFRFLLRELSDRKDHPVHLPKWEHPRWRR